MSAATMRDACLAHARRLERVLAQACDGVDANLPAAPTHLQVRIGTHVHALPLACVREVLPPLHVVRLRDAPAGIRGLVQARGRAVAVHATQPDAPPHPVLVLVEHDGACHAIEVDTVLALGDAGDVPVLDIAGVIARQWPAPVPTSS